MNPPVPAYYITGKSKTQCLAAKIMQRTLDAMESQRSMASGEKWNIYDLIIHILYNFHHCVTHVSIITFRELLI